MLGFGCLLAQMVRYDSVDGKCFLSFLFWFHGCSLACELFDLRFFHFPLTLSPKVYDGDSYLTSLGRMVTA